MHLNIQYDGRSIPLAAGETVLEGFERAGVAVPSSCRAGVCQSCLMRVVDGPIPPKSQDGLKESLKMDGYFLSCVSRPEASFSCEPANVAAFRGPVTVLEIRIIGLDIALVRFERPRNLVFGAGQFLTLRRNDDLSRSYSIASPSNQNRYFDIHVRRVSHGRMSSWMHDHLQPGDVLWAEGPKGDCMYYPNQTQESLILVGTGTGMAPLFAIADDAASRSHEGSITIYQGALSEKHLYLVDECKALAARHSNIRYLRVVTQGISSSSVAVGDLKDVVLSQLGSAASVRAYLCGSPSLVRDLKKKLFLRGLSLKRIHMDPFVGSD